MHKEQEMFDWQLASAWRALGLNLFRLRRRLRLIAVVMISCDPQFGFNKVHFKGHSARGIFASGRIGVGKETSPSARCVVDLEMLHRCRLAPGL